MRTVAAAGASDAADLVAIADLLPFLDQNAVQMGLAGAYAETMIDFHHSAVTRFPAADNDLAGSGGKDRRFDEVGKVETLVHRPLTGERIAPTPEFAGTMGVVGRGGERKYPKT